jgi:hypothetical protein
VGSAGLPHLPFSQRQMAPWASAAWCWLWTSAKVTNCTGQLASSPGFFCLAGLREGRNIGEQNRQQEADDGEASVLGAGLVSGRSGLISWSSQERILFSFLSSSWTPGAHPSYLVWNWSAKIEQIYVTSNACSFRCSFIKQCKLTSAFALLNEIH